MSSPSSFITHDVKRETSPSLRHRSHQPLNKNSKQTPSPSPLESLPVEIKILIFRHLKHQSDLNALKSASTTFQLFYRHNITAIILNSLHDHGTSLRQFISWLKAAMSSSEFYIPLVQGMKAAYIEFHKVAPRHRHYPSPPPTTTIRSATHPSAAVHSSPVQAYRISEYRRVSFHPYASESQVPQQQRLFTLDWDQVFDIAIQTLKKGMESSDSARWSRREGSSDDVVMRDSGRCNPRGVRFDLESVRLAGALSRRPR